jgi:hypothetical protein
MSTDRVDFLFRGSHPAFYWAAALLKQKGESVAIYSAPESHAWEGFPVEVLALLGLKQLKTDRDLHPIQILTHSRRLGVFADLAFTKKDFLFCAGNAPSPELDRGLSFYAKGTDYPVVFGESSSELLEACHRMEYFEKTQAEIQSHVVLHLQKMGVVFLKDEQSLPIAEQTVILDLKRAKIFRTKYEIILPLKDLPVGASKRMLFVERNSPMIEMVHIAGKLHLRTLAHEEPLLIEQMLSVIQPYFPEQKWNASDATVVAENVSHYEWGEVKSNIDASKLGTWLISPALNNELGERSLYVRISDLLTKKFKKQQVFEIKELFVN